MSEASLHQAKQIIRERIWARLEAEQAAPTGVFGRIPNFVGSDTAADRLAAHATWQDSKIIKAVPDKAQRPVRARALHGGKRLYMAVPKLAGAEPFVLLDPSQLAPRDVSAEQAADSKTALIVGQSVGVDQMEPVDLVVVGSVAVNYSGARLGKGAGYSDIEVALLVEAGLITTATTIVTTLHDLQVVDEDLPEAAHDFSVDLIITPSQAIECGPARRPKGLDLSLLSSEQVKAMPVLKWRA